MACKKKWILENVLCFTAEKVAEHARRSVANGPVGETSRIESPYTTLTYSFNGLGWTRPACNSDTVHVESDWAAPHLVSVPASSHTQASTPGLPVRIRVFVQIASEGIMNGGRHHAGLHIYLGNYKRGNVYITRRVTENTVAVGGGNIFWVYVRSLVIQHATRTGGIILSVVW